MKIALSFLLLPIVAGAIEVEPWLGEIYQFQFQGTYSYSHYPNVQNASVPLKNPSNDQLVAGALQWAFDENWDGEIELEFVHTPRQSWGYRSAALQVRYLWLNDVKCDPVSLMTGLNIRNVSSVSLRDVSSPYHANMNFELNAALGKEWSECYDWLFRLFGFFGIGMGNRGSPWLRGRLSFQGNLHGRHQGQLFALGYFGLGDKTRVDTEHFWGWAKFRHQSIDLGAGYRYLFDYWGSLDLDLTYRVYAHSFPKELVAIYLTYTLPFSCF